MTTKAYTPNSATLTNAIDPFCGNPVSAAKNPKSAGMMPKTESEQLVLEKLHQKRCSQNVPRLRADHRLYTRDRRFQNKQVSDGVGPASAPVTACYKLERDAANPARRVRLAWHQDNRHEAGYEDLDRERQHSAPVSLATRLGPGRGRSATIGAGRLRPQARGPVERREPARAGWALGRRKGGREAPLGREGPGRHGARHGPLMISGPGALVPPACPAPALGRLAVAPSACLFPSECPMPLVGEVGREPVLHALRGSLPQMMHRITDLYCPTDAKIGEDSPLLPETLRLLKRLESMVAEELEHFGIQNPGRTAAYRARPESNLPYLRFHVTDADQNLLAFAGKKAPGFEILQVFCAGFQYHWRSDLARAFDEQVPLISRSYGLADTRELVVEHLAVPLIRKHRVREIWGWLTFSQELDASREWAGLDAVSMFRRTERSRPLRLPIRLYDPERRHVVPEAMLRALKEKWRSATG